MTLTRLASHRESGLQTVRTRDDGRSSRVFRQKRR
jgi:hypothetical protein